LSVGNRPRNVGEWPRASQILECKPSWRTWQELGTGSPSKQRSARPGSIVGS